MPPLANMTEEDKDFYHAGIRQGAREIISRILWDAKETHREMIEPEYLNWKLRDYLNSNLADENKLK